MFIGENGKFVIITYLGVFFSLSAIAFVLNQQLTLAMMAFILTGICDLFDGSFARMFDRTVAEEQFGVEIDSLSDMINFVAFPSVMLLSQYSASLFSLIVVVVYTLCAISRLAHFNRLAKNEEPSHYFVGMPVTYSALFLPLLYLFDQWLDLGQYQLISHLTALLLGFLFILNIRIPKPNRWAYIFFAVLAVLTLIGLGMVQW